MMYGMPSLLTRKETDVCCSWSRKDRDSILSRGIQGQSGKDCGNHAWSRGYCISPTRNYVKVAEDIGRGVEWAFFILFSFWGPVIGLFWFPKYSLFLYFFLFLCPTSCHSMVTQIFVFLRSARHLRRMPVRPMIVTAESNRACRVSHICLGVCMPLTSRLLFVI